MHAAGLMHYLMEHPRNRRLMARAALNVLGHAKDYPVDISELRVLSPESRAILNAFLQWYVSNRDFRIGEVFLPHWTGMAGRVQGSRHGRGGR